MSKRSDLLVAALENEGVDSIFGIPGEKKIHPLYPSWRSGRLRFRLSGSSRLTESNPSPPEL